MDESRRSRIGSAWLPLLVLALGLCLSAMAVRTLHDSLQARELAAGERTADALESEVARRLGRALSGLNSVRAAFAVHGGMDSAQLARWMERRELYGEHPGLRGFGIIERVARDDAAAFAQRQRDAGAPEFEIRSSGTDPILYVVRSVEPLGRNASALGFDSGSSPVARAAIEKAVSSGIPTLTAPLVLQQDERRGQGWVLYAPLYRGEPRDGRQRVDGLEAIAFTPFTARELLDDTADQAGLAAAFRLYDVEDGQRRLVYDAAPAHGRPDALVLSRPLLVGQRLLQLEVLPRIDTQVSRRLPLLVGAGGAMLSVSLAWLTWLLASGRRRALAHAAAKEREARRLAGVVRRTSSAVFMTDPQGRLTWVNDAFLAIAGRSTRELVGEDVFGVLQVQQALDVAERLRLGAELRAGKGQRVELASRRADGSPFIVEVAVEPELDDEGNVAGYSGIAIDITARKQVEVRLAARETFLRTITDNMPAQISYWDADGRCRFANRRYREVWARTERALLGAPMSDILRPAQMRALRPRLKALGEGMPQQFEYAIAGADGRSTIWQVHMLPDLDEATGRAEGFFVLANEVTELKLARDAALQASQAKTRFLSNMSHEIRTPMNAILGMLTLLRGTALSPRQEDYASKAEGAARSLLSLLNDVLDFSKIEAGKMQLDCRAFSVDRLLADLSVILSASVGDKDLEVLYDLDPAVPDALIGDDMRLRQILINLAGNAIKFTGRGEVVVSTRLLAAGGRDVKVEFAVRDSGIGISEEHQASLFQDYVQASGATARTFGGTGLGLGICRRLTELMGGQLQLRSRPGEGSRFSFALTLPRAPAAQAVLPATARAGVRRVLIIDDNELARVSLAALAASVGWSVDTAADGESGIERVRLAHERARPYDAVFLDWRMPGMDGWEASLRIRSHSAHARMPLVVMVTAQGRESLGHLPASEQALIDAFLVKPVTATMLREAVQGVLHAPAGARPEPAAPRPLAGVRLLVAEDNLVNQQIARELLQAQGADVEIAPDGRDAVDRVEAGERYDCVLMDMMMPVMDGLAATRRIRALTAGATLPIVAMTANAMESDRADCLAAGMNDHVGKPVVLAEVVAAVLRAIGTRAPVAAAGPLPGEAAAPEPVPVLDRAAAVARMAGNVALFEQMLPLFAANLRQAAADLQAASESAAHDEMVRLVHTLKGTAGTMGAERLAGIARRAERAMREGVAGRLVAGEVSGAIDETLQALAGTPAP